MDESGYIKFQVEETKLAMLLSVPNAIGISGIEWIQIPK